MRKLLWLLVPAAALLVGCYSIETSYVVNEDGSGTQTTRFSVPSELFSAAGEDAPPIEEIESDPDIEALRHALGDAGSMTFFSSAEEGFGFELVMSVPASDDFGQALADQAAALPQESDFSFADIQTEPPTIRREGDTWSFRLELPPITGEDIAALTGDPETAGMASLFLDQVTMTTRVKLPGEVTESNADEVLEDGTLVWTQTGADEGRVLTATSDLGGSNLRLILIVVGVLAAAVVLATVAYFATRGPSADEDESAEAPPAEPTV